MAAISLTKGQKVDLTKSNPGLTKVAVGLGWDVNKYDGQGEFDLDASVFLLGENGKVTSSADLIFFNNPQGGNGSVVHAGDNRTGEGEGDDELVTIDLAKVPETIQRIVFTITIYDAENRRQNFGMVSNSYTRILDHNNQELIRYDLGEDFSIETAIVVGELYRHNGEWKFNAIGSGFQNGLVALCSEYGVEVQ